MPRSRRFLTFCALIAALAWTNVQAMACCWTWNSDDETAISETIGGKSNSQTSADDSSQPMAHTGCHGSTSNTDSESPKDHPSESHPTQGNSEADLTVACGVVIGSTHAAESACCESSAPAEDFSAVPHFETLPPQAFYASVTSLRSAGSLTGAHTTRAPDSPRFLALERLLI